MIAVDLFCGAGGAAMGLHRTGLFERIIGVDIEPQPDYPFVFCQTDATEFDLSQLRPDFVWASPPCQQFVSLAKMPRGGGTRALDLIEPTRSLLAGHPFSVIENVRAAPIRGDIRLEGGNVGIPHMGRHRKFEVSWPTGLHSQPHTIKPILYRIYGTWQSGRVPETMRCRAEREARGMPRNATVEEVEALWEVDWLTQDKRHALTQMVPPAYSRYVVLDAVKHGLGN